MSPLNGAKKDFGAAREFCSMFLEILVCWILLLHGVFITVLGLAALSNHQSNHKSLWRCDGLISCLVDSTRKKMDLQDGIWFISLDVEHANQKVLRKLQLKLYWFLPSRHLACGNVTLSCDLWQVAAYWLVGYCSFAVTDTDSCFVSQERQGKFEN